MWGGSSPSGPGVEVSDRCVNTAEAAEGGEKKEKIEARIKDGAEACQDLGCKGMSLGERQSN